MYLEGNHWTDCRVPLSDSGQIGPHAITMHRAWLLQRNRGCIMRIIPLQPSAQRGMTVF
jgi:hypothetical protein